MPRLALALACLLAATPAVAEDAAAPPKKAGKASKRPKPPADDSDLPSPWKPEANPNVDKLPAFLGIFGPTALVEQAGFVAADGRWIEYDVVQPEDTDFKTAPSLRIQQVGPAPAGARWIELVVQADGIGMAAIRMLCQGEKRGNVKRLVAKMPDMPPLELPIESASVYEGDDLIETLSTGYEGPLTLVGRETVSVPLGRFEADHYRGGKGTPQFDYWVATDRSLPFVRLLKFTTRDGIAIAKATGVDATPRVLVAAPTSPPQ